MVYLTLGDPTIYCSFGYIARILLTDGYQVEFVSGVTSFCAVSARLKQTLVDWDEPLHIIPAGHNNVDIESGTFVIMKAVGQIQDIKEKLKRSGRIVKMVENCGMENERVYTSIEDMPDSTGYYTMIIAK